MFIVIYALHQYIDFTSFKPFITTYCKSLPAIYCFNSSMLTLCSLGHEALHGNWVN